MVARHRYNGLPLEGVEALCSFMKFFLAVLPVTIHLALCSLFVFTPKMLGILVGMDQTDSCAVQRSLAGRRHSIRDTEAVSHGPCDHRDSEECVDTVVGFPVVQDVQISLLMRRGIFPWSDYV